MSRARYGVLGVGIDAVDPGRARDAIEGWIAGGERGYVCVSNVHVVMEARGDEDLRRIVNAAALAVPDGMPLVWVGRLKGHAGVRRVYGPDLTLLHCERLRAAVLVGVGAAFDFHTGRVRQAPRWMMRAGLEWAFRLSQEPRRLWRRYLVYNPLFVIHLTLELLGLRRYPPVAGDGAGPA